jgi:hypothetical protein
MIRELLPIEAYLPPSRPFPWRTALVMAFLWGVPMTTVLLVSEGSEELGLPVVLVTGTMGGLLFGILWTGSFWRSILHLTRRVYNADPRMVPQPPPGDYDFRLACSYLASRHISIGGHLYIGEEDWVFVPHRKNLKRHRTPRTIRRNTITQVDAGSLPPTVFARLFSSEPDQRLLVRTDGEESRFRVPHAEKVASELG